MKLNLEDINKAFESKARLGIMSVLLVNESIDFVSLKNLLELTDGQPYPESGGIGVYPKLQTIYRP